MTKSKITITRDTHPQNSRSLRRLAATGAMVGLVALSALGAGCGKQAYVVSNSQAQSQAPGSFAVPPKVDILVVQDDTGSSRPIFENISRQLLDFTSDLQNQGWDYHMATIPLTMPRTISQVMGSKYDPNWGSEWLAPYPGASQDQVSKIKPSAFRMPGDYSDFLTGDDTSNALNGGEPAFENIKNMLYHASAKNSGFLRSDAMLAVVVLSTGDDTTNRNICSGSYARDDGWVGPCDLIDYAQNGTIPSRKCGTSGANPSPYCNNYESSMSSFKTQLKNVKGSANTNQVKWYSVVSAYHNVTGGNCMGANSFVGSRYQDMTNHIGGKTYDICTIPIPTVLDSIAANLQSIEYNFYTHYLFMAQKPEPSTITVWRNPGGDVASRVQIPEGAANGWTFAGEVSNVFTTSIGSPNVIPTLNLGSGWAVKLNGSAKIGGKDTATVDFKPYGTQNSAEQ